MSADLALSSGADLMTTVELPTKRQEAWRYAPHRTLGELSFGAATGLIASIPDGILDGLPAIDGPRIVIVNGSVDLARSDLGGDVPGMTIGSRAEMLAAGSDLPDLDGDSAHRYTSSPSEAYAAINLMFGTDGAVIDVAAGVTVDRPIHLIDVHAPDQLGTASSSRTHVRLGAGSVATIVETRISANAGFGGSNVGTVVSLDAGARLDHVVLQDLAEAQVHLGRVEVDQAAGSVYTSRAFNIGAAYGRLEYHVRLNEPEASTDLAGLYFGTGDQVLDQQVTVVHAAENCISRQAFRGVLDEQSTGVFNGGIDVRVGADGTDAAQSNDNLLLSNRAEANTQPRLEILADEVKCAHGATVGRLDEQALYYLRSRGIPAREARGLLIDAFADRIIDEVGTEPVRSWIARRLGHADHE